MIGYVVESLMHSPTGLPPKTACIYVATETRANEIAAGAPGRTVRAIAYEDMPLAARENLERAAREKS
jgi:hypothetical protein